MEKLTELLETISPSHRLESLEKLETKNKIEATSLAHQIEIARHLPPVERLFGNFILKGDFTILFADTGIGKSIFATQLANCLASCTECLEQANDGKPMKILYIDLELDGRDLKMRYSNFKPHDNFLRIGKDQILEVYGDINVDIICQIIEQVAPEAVIIDNVSAVALNSTSDANEAISVLKPLDHLRKRLSITTILIDHTPKIEQGKPIEANHLAGSKKMQIFLDGLIAIGQDHTDINCRYLKQLKVRNGTKLDKVIRLNIEADPYLHFEYLGLVDEKSLMPKSDVVHDAMERHSIIVSEFFEQPQRYTDFCNDYANAKGKSIAEAKRIFGKLKGEDLIMKDPDGLWRSNGNVIKLSDTMSF